MIRIFTEQLTEACNALNAEDIKFDLDSGDRILLSEQVVDDAATILADNDIDFDVI